MLRQSVFVCFLVVANSAIASTAFAQAFLPIGHLSSGPNFSAAAAVSDNGIATGNSDFTGGYVGIRWSQATGLESIGDLPGGDLNSQPMDISADGSTIVGYGMVATGYEAYRWTSSGGYQPLGFYGSDAQSFATSISADGSTIAGQSEATAGSGSQTVRWTESEGFVPLGRLPGGAFSFATAVSADGSIIVGASNSSRASTEATRWDNDVISSMEQRIFVDDHYEYPYSTAQGISDDGSVIVTVSEGSSYRWTAATGFVQIPGTKDQGNLVHQMSASGISGDGTMIVGGTDGSNQVNGYIERASIWTAETGHVYLQNYLKERGVEGLAGWTLLEAAGISHNGRYIAGMGLDPTGKVEGFVVDLSLVPELSLLPGDANNDGLVDGADYTVWADHFLLTGQTWTTGDFNADGVVDGADYTIWADHFSPARLSLAAVPEPSTFALAGIGILAFLARAHRRFNKARL